MFMVGPLSLNFRNVKGDSEYENASEIQIIGKDLVGQMEKGYKQWQE